MNMQASNVLAPPPPKSLEDTGLGMVMMRDILLKTMFRQNLDQVTELARVMCLPTVVTQELVDLARGLIWISCHRSAKRPWPRSVT